MHLNMVGRHVNFLLLAVPLVTLVTFVTAQRTTRRPIDWRNYHCGKSYISRNACSFNISRAIQDWQWGLTCDGGEIQYRTHGQAIQDMRVPNWNASNLEVNIYMKAERDRAFWLCIDRLRGRWAEAWRGRHDQGAAFVRARPQTEYDNIRTNRQRNNGSSIHLGKPRRGYPFCVQSEVRHPNSNLTSNLHSVRILISPPWRANYEFRFGYSIWYGTPPTWIRSRDRQNGQNPERSMSRSSFGQDSFGMSYIGTGNSNGRNYMGRNSVGMNSDGQNYVGRNSFDRNSFEMNYDGLNAYGHNSYGQSPYGRDPIGNNPSGQNYISQNPSGQNHMGQNPFGQNYMGQNPYGRNNMGQNPYGRDPIGINPSGQNYIGRNPYRHKYMGRNPSGQNNMGQNPSGRNPIRIYSSRRKILF